MVVQKLIHFSERALLGAPEEEEGALAELKSGKGEGDCQHPDQTLISNETLYPWSLSQLRRVIQREARGVAEVTKMPREQVGLKTGEEVALVPK